MKRKSIVAFKGFLLTLRLLTPTHVSPAGTITPLDILFGHRGSIQRGNLYMAHHVGFTQRVLAGTLKAAGFGAVATVRSPERFDLWAFATKRAVSDVELKEETRRHLNVVAA